MLQDTAFGAYEFTLWSMLDDANHLCHYAQRVHEEAPKISDEAVRYQIDLDEAYLRDASHAIKSNCETLLTDSLMIMVDLENLSRNLPDYQCEILEVKKTILRDIDLLRYWFGNFTERLGEMIPRLKSHFGKAWDWKSICDVSATMEEISWSMENDVTQIQEKFEIALSVYADIALVLINNNIIENGKENK